MSEQQIGELKVTPDVTITEELLSKISKDTDPRVLQYELDTVFTPDRRAKKLAGASVDNEGRPVRYFRYMKLERLQKFLKEGKQIHTDYFQDINAVVNQSELRSLFTGLLNRDLDDDEFIKKRREIRETDIKELLPKFFPDIDPTILDNIEEKLTYANILPLIKKNIPEDVIMRAHTGSALQKFSHFLSLSVGGPIRDKLNGIAYIEMVIPDIHVKPSKYGEQGEKEVFVEELRAEWIAQVFTDTNTLWEREIVNPDTPVGKYGTTNDWRWNEDTENYLPVSLINQ